MPRFEIIEDPVCAEEGCESTPAQGPFCRRHYNKLRMRQWRYGTQALQAKPSIEERFMSKVDSSGDCWLWTSPLSLGGYATFAVGRKGQRAHRWAYEHWVGPIPKGLQIDHICRVRHCVNPEHLRPVTPQGNSQYRAEQVTHCPKGHEYSPENTYISNGSRICKTCNRDKSKAYQRELYARGEDTVENRRKTKCPEGHPYGPAQRGVKRICQVCMTLRMRERRGSKLGDVPITQPNGEKTHCPKGHPYSTENTYITKTGGRVCRTCNTENARRYRKQKAYLIGR